MTYTVSGGALNSTQTKPNALVHDSRGIEIVNFTISLALSAGTLIASAGTPYRLVPAHFYPWSHGTHGIQVFPIPMHTSRLAMSPGLQNDDGPTTTAETRATAVWRVVAATLRFCGVEWDTADNVHSMSAIKCHARQHRLPVTRPVWARGRCRTCPPRFLAECCKRQLNQVTFVLLYCRLSTFSDLYWVFYLYFPALFCLSVSVKWLAVKTASEMTYIVSGGALNSTPTNQASHTGWPSTTLSYDKCALSSRSLETRIQCSAQRNQISSVCISFSTYDTIRDAILTCARKPTWVSLIYRTEPTTKKCRNRKKLKVENRHAQK